MSLFPFRRRVEKEKPETPKQAGSVADLKAFERQYPGVQLELRELRARIEENPTETEPLLDRARYFLNSRLPSNRFNCADDCSRALELDPQCASAYALRAQSLGDVSHPNKISGRWPPRAALDYLSAFALDSTDFASRAAFLKICAVIFEKNNKTEELAALREMLESRVGKQCAEEAMKQLAFDLSSLV